VYSSIVRTALKVLARCHGDRQWSVTNEPYALLPMGIALNLARCRPDDETLAAALLFGACDSESRFTYEEMADLFDRFDQDGEPIIHVHQQTSWQLVMNKAALPVNYDWEDYFVNWRAHIDHVGYRAIEVLVAENYFLITELAARAKQADSIYFWCRLFEHFPKPHPPLEFGSPPYELVVGYFRGMATLLRSRGPRNAGPLFSEFFRVLQQMHHDFRVRGLVK
jgi:hypothetical protein